MKVLKILKEQPLFQHHSITALSSLSLSLSLYYFLLLSFPKPTTLSLTQSHLYVVVYSGRGSSGTMSARQ